VLSVGSWVAAAVLLVLFGIRYVGPGLDREPEIVELQGPIPGHNLGERLVPPNRPLANPVAQQLVEIGNNLVSRPRDRQEAARQLLALTENPESLGDDMTAYLAVRSAYWQLRRDPEVKGSLEAAMMLWDTAERIEDNAEISSAIRESSAAQ
jgi:hypothetical protein